MRALSMTEPCSSAAGTAVINCPEPEPGPGEVSVDVAYAGVNFIDVMARRGDPGYASAWPYIPGLEIAGKIRRVGSDVVGLRAGQRVAAFTAGGGLAEIALARAELTVALPDAVALPHAASAPLMLSTALLLLTDATRLQPGESVLMHSASGGVGSAVAQMVPLLGGGLRIGTVGRTGKIADALHAGWDVAISREVDVAAAVRAEAERGVDVVLDPTGTEQLELDLAVAAPGARIALFGNAGGGVPEPLPPVGRLIGGNVALAGFSISRLTMTAPQRVTSTLGRVLGWLASRDLEIAVTEVGSLEDVPAVHDRLATGQGTGKYVARIAP